ncbi:MAG: atsA 21 [Verrucomicrobiales bacterium]|nr:atsA 21 [Verrucomicrobiales bacterium]
MNTIPMTNLVRLLLIFLVWSSVDSRAADATRPNVVFIFADDLGYGDIGCYGAKDIRTPNIDKLARQGTRFTSFYVAQAVCTASRAAFLTGCYANRVGMAGALNHTSNTGINTRETMLSEMFKRQGYATAIYGKWHLGHREPFLPTHRGFDEWFGIPYSNDNGPLHPVTRGIPSLPMYENDKVVELDPDQSQFTRRLTERAVGFIEKNRDKPFFLYLPHIMPHVPIFASARFKGTSKRGLYGDVVQELDWSVGEIMAALRKHGLEERTIVVFTSDNGPFLSYGEHAGSARPLREGKLTTFGGGVQVPCVMRWPGHIPAGRVTDELVTTMDLFVSFARWMKAPLPQQKIDGTDLTPFLLGVKGAKGRESFWFYSGDELQAVRVGDWKLHLPHEYLTVAASPGKNGKPSNWENLKPEAIELSGIRGIASRHGYRVEKIGLALFNLKDDPGETHDVASAHPEIVTRLQTEVDRARADLGDTLTGTKPTHARPPGDVSAPARQTSASLGQPGRTAKQAGKSPVKVFVLAGQSNMEGQAVVDLEGKDYNEGKGTLDMVMREPAMAQRFRHLKDTQGKWVVRDDVWVRYQREHGPLLAGPLGFGFSVYGDKHHFGPELQFGHAMGDHFENQVLLIKTAWGGKSLFEDFRPPSSGGKVGPYYTKMITEIQEALSNLPKDFPTYDGGGYELAGFVWYQGWNDGVNPNTAIPEYEANLVNLIKDVRKDLGVPKLPVVIGELTGPWVKAPPDWTKLREAQAAAAAHPEFTGNVAFVSTRDFVQKPEDSPNPTHGHHEFGNAKTYLLVGDALGNALKELLAK